MKLSKETNDSGAGLVMLLAGFVFLYMILKWMYDVGPIWSTLAVLGAFVMGVFVLPMLAGGSFEDSMTMLTSPSWWGIKE